MKSYKAWCFFFGAVIFWGPLPVYAASPRTAIQKGNRLYTKGDYEDSIKEYKEALARIPESDIVNFDLGTALYKKQRYEEAVTHLQKTLLSEKEDLRQKASYNLGNALYKLGIAKEKEDIGFAVSSLQNALKQYEQAFSLDKKDEDAQYNYDFVKKELERLLQKQKQDKNRKNQQTSESAQSQKDKDEEASQESQEPRNQQRQEDQSQQKQEESSSSQDQDREDSRQPDQRSQEQSSAQLQEGTSQQGQAPQSADAQELTKSEAQMLLKEYQQTEEPQGLLHVFQGRRDSSPVTKDW